MAPIKPMALLSSGNENKKASKPLIEKRRRARINCSLAELKSIIVDTDKSPHLPTARPPKLEKADILEMTVAYVKRLKVKNKTSTAESDKDYVEGYDFCLNLVHRFLDNDPDPHFKTRLLNHLNGHRPPMSVINPTEPSAMDDSSSSYSSTSRSLTPSSLTMDTSSSPFTDSEQEMSSSLLLRALEVHPVPADTKLERLSPPVNCYEPQHLKEVRTCNSAPLNLVSRMEQCESQGGMQHHRMNNHPANNQWQRPSEDYYLNPLYHCDNETRREHSVHEDSLNHPEQYYSNSEPWRPW